MTTFISTSCHIKLLFKYLYLGLCLGFGVERHFQQYFSYIVVVSFIGGENWSTWRKPPSYRNSPTNWHIMLYRVHLPWLGFELATLVVFDTYCIGSWKSNYHTTSTTTARIYIYIIKWDRHLLFLASPSATLFLLRTSFIWSYDIFI